MRPEAWCFETVAVDPFMKKQKEEHSTKPTVKMRNMLSLFGKEGGGGGFGAYTQTVKMNTLITQYETCTHFSVKKKKKSLF